MDGRVKKVLQVPFAFQRAANLPVSQLAGLDGVPMSDKEGDGGWRV